MSSKTLYLVCNAHLDPVWLWEWEEGAAETLSTFRAAAQFCEEFEEFVFNHNEAILYQWIESYDPELFLKIQQLVKKGKWNIMGGWYLQPDCNLPSGESFIRQILSGKKYFKKKFGVEPRIAAALQDLIDYPRDKLHEALEDLLFCEFHDILPGSSIPQVEAYALQRMDHGLEILSRLKAKAFFALIKGSPEAACSQVLCVNGIQDSVPNIVAFPESMIQHEVKKKYWVKDLDEAFYDCYRKGVLPSEAKFSWARSGRPIDLHNYQFFPGGIPPGNQRMFFRYLKPGIL